MRITGLLFLFLVVVDSHACLNYYVTNEKGEDHSYESSLPFQISVPDKDLLLSSLKEKEKSIREGKGEKQYWYISNYAVDLIRLGRSKEALQIFLRLAGQKPGEYQLLANLATAYELNGYPDSAYKYMQQSLKINTAAHNNSEWFHLRLLEAVIEHRDKGTPVEKLDILKLDTAVSFATAYQIGEQLSERVPLSAAPNVFLSKSIEESADFFKRMISVDWSVKLYAIAVAYAADDTAVARIWRKMEMARAKVVELSKKDAVNTVVKAASELNPFSLLFMSDLGKDVRRQLLSARWKMKFSADINKWKNYKPYNEQDLLIPDFILNP